MGADGGLCWVKLKDRERFIELVDPFGFLYYDDYYDGYHYDWLEENSEQFEDGDYYIGTYGTPQYCDLRELEHTVRGIEYLEESDDWFAEDWRDLTFEEALLDGLTSPYGYGLDFLEPLYRYNKRQIDKKLEQGGHIGYGLWPMKMTDWAKEVKKTYYPGTFGYAETWT